MKLRVLRSGFQLEACCGFRASTETALLTNNLAMPAAKRLKLLPANCNGNITWPPKKGANKPKMSNFEHKKSVLFNLEDLAELVGGDTDMIREILALFLQETPQTLRHLNAAIEQEDYAAMYQAAHKLKSSLKLLKAEAALQLALQTEEEAKKPEERAVGKIRALAQALEERTKETIGAIQQSGILQ